MSNVLTLDDQNNEKSSSENSSQESSLFSKYAKDASDESTNSSNEQEVVLTELPSSELVFEITYLSDPTSKQSAEVYTKTEPKFTTNGVVAINDAFGALLLKETVLNREVVERKCRRQLQQPNFTVDCKSGILIKAIEPQNWMFQDETITKQEFDKAVLEVFRVVQERVTKELQEAAVEQAKALALLEQERLKKQRELESGQAIMGTMEGIPIQHNQNGAYNLKPGDPGYNPNNDPNRRGKPMPVNDESLDDF